MPKITAYIIAFNEAAKIEAAVSSVLWADEVLVADSNSTDNTAALATALGARVVQVPFHGFGDLRNRTLEHCTHECCLLYTSPSPRDGLLSRMPSSA